MEDRDYQGLDPAEVKKARRLANEPHEYAALPVGNGENRQAEEMENQDYQGLDPVDVVEAQERARLPDDSLD